jgi:hypothetical protein
MQTESNFPVSSKGTVWGLLPIFSSFNLASNHKINVAPFCGQLSYDKMSRVYAAQVDLHFSASKV